MLCFLWKKRKNPYFSVLPSFPFKQDMNPDTDAPRARVQPLLRKGDFSDTFTRIVALCREVTFRFPSTSVMQKLPVVFSTFTYFSMSVWSSVEMSATEQNTRSSAETLWVRRSPPLHQSLENMTPCCVRMVPLWKMETVTPHLPLETIQHTYAGLSAVSQQGHYCRVL